MANVAKVAMRFRSGDVTDIIVTAHVKAPDGRDPLDDTARAAIANAFINWWSAPGAYGDELRIAYASAIVLTEVAVWRVEPALDGPTIVGPLDMPGADDLLTAKPPQVTFLLGLRTSENTRRYRGRMYLPAFGALTGTDIASGFIRSATLDRLAVFAANLASWVAEIVGETFALCVYSRVERASHAVTHFAMPDRMTTQRRRMKTPYGHWAYALDGTPLG